MAAIAIPAASLFSYGAIDAPTSLAGQRPPIAVRALSRFGGVSRYAFVERSTIVRSSPSSKGRSLATVGTVTFWDTSTIVQALAQTAGSTATGWTQVRVARAPSDVIGWVPTRVLSRLYAVHTWLKVNRERLTATLIRDGRAIFRVPVGVGQPQWPTPAGQFFVEVSITPTERNGVYGAFAFGTSAHSNVLTEWPNEGQIGIHGTNEPWLIPGHISHGCIRMRNSDIERLAHLMPVGTPVTIE